MVMFYFSGTGNSKYVAEQFCENMKAACHSIEEVADFEKIIHAEDVIGFCYPVYMSRVPRIMREFVAQHMDALNGKKLIIFCTQLLLSGDGTRAFAALFPKNHINVIYTEHFFMPNNVNNVFILPSTSDKSIQKCTKNAKRKLKSVCLNIENGIIKKRGFNPLSRGLGLIQGVFMSQTESLANKSVKVNDDCTKCGICVNICPTRNLVLENERIKHNHNCTMCYRCMNKCPKMAITMVFPGKVRWQYQGIAKEQTNA